jgi:hypothetical protein
MVTLPHSNIMTITDTHTHLYSEEFDQDRDEMIQRALNGISDFYSRNRLFLHSVYDLEKNLSRTCFSDDGTASYPCKGELFRGITTCRGRRKEKKILRLEKLELIYIGIKLFIRTTDRFQETNSISKAIQATY